MNTQRHKIYKVQSDSTMPTMTQKLNNSLNYKMSTQRDEVSYK